MTLFKKRKNKHLRQRCERMAGIIVAAAWDRMADPQLSKMLEDGRVKQALEELANTPDECMEQLLDMLEAGVPKEYQHLLKKENS